MNRTLLFALLGLSLVGNTWFLFARAREAAAPPDGDRAAPAAVAPGVRGASAATPPKAATAAAKTGEPDAVAPRGLTWHAPTTDDEFRALVNDLRAAGFPSPIINRIVTELYQQRRLAESPEAKVPFWQRRTTQKEMQEYRREIARALEAILGPDARRSVQIDAVTRARQYGNLADTKIDAIAAVERDYQEMQTDLSRNQDGMFFNSDEWAARQQQRSLLKTEMRADLERILTPAELADYELRNSDTARSLSFAVQNIAVNAAEFAALYEIRRAFETANPALIGRVTTEQMTARQAGELAAFEQARALLADDRFYGYLAATNYEFRNLAGLTKQFPSVTPAVAYQALQLRYEVQQARNSLATAGAQNTPESLAAAYAGWNTRLEALLGPEAAAAYRKTNFGRTFVAPTARPANRTVPPRG
ncbi:MAG: hypothetical protein HYV96_08715 [Opitutae bacterium]|nr:hypothetical protein [Opitutae bacterium]